MSKFVGFDLGGTNIKAAVVDDRGGSLAGLSEALTLAQQGPDAVVERMMLLTEQVIAASGCAPAEIRGIGIGVPGRIDLELGNTVFLPNFPGNWPGVPLAGRISDRFHLPAFLINDARAMTLGEWAFGAGASAAGASGVRSAGVESMACFTLGTGIGGGLILNGSLYLGLDGSGGELGHQTIDPNGPICGCGNRGCLEAYASGPAMAALALKAVVQGRTTRIGELAGFDLNRITPAVIAQAAGLGDPVGLEIFEQIGTYLGIAVANVLVMFGPRRVVIGGGVAQAGDLLFKPIRRTVNERVFMMPKEQVEILPATLGLSAGMIGAAVWASQRLG